MVSHEFAAWLLVTVTQVSLFTVYILQPYLEPIKSVYQWRGEVELRFVCFVKAP